MLKNYDKTKKLTVSWQSPSNIALVKYWGKKAGQMPKNPSISFTLSKCVTKTKLSISPREDFEKSFSFEVLFEKNDTPDFYGKIERYFNELLPYSPFLKDFHFKIETENTFPHSSGIASSASAFSALSLCILSIEQKLGLKIEQDDFFKRASFYSRIGSGSAARSTQGGFMLWGETPSIKQSSDNYAINYPYKIHKVFGSLQDTILIIDRGQKKVSSTLGHKLMEENIFADSRFIQAQNNIEALKDIFESGDMKSFGKIVESEALTLHAMMMCSGAGFILMKPNTLIAIEKIRSFRQATNIDVYFTLDAGANIHLIYPEAVKAKLKYFIEGELKDLCYDGFFIEDKLGKGPVQLKK